MATQEQLQDEVVRKIQDPSYDADEIREFFNLCLKDVESYRDPKTGFELFLPALDTTASLETSITDPYVSFPTNYLKNLHTIETEDQGNDIVICPNLQALKALFTAEEWTTAGQLDAVAPVGTSLYYGRTPSVAITLTIHYYKKLTPIAEATTTLPAEIPEHLQRDLLVNYACREIYSEIEEESVDAPAGTRKHAALYMKAIGELYAWVRDEKSIQKPYRPRKVQTF